MAGRVISIALLANDRMSRGFNDAADSADDFADQLQEVDRSAGKASASLSVLGTASTRGMGGLTKGAATGTRAVTTLGAASAASFAGMGVGIAAAAAAMAGIGIKIAATNSQVRSEFAKTKAEISKTSQAFGTPFVQPLVQTAGIIRSTFASIAPQLTAAMSTIAPSLVPVVQGVSGMVKNLAGLFQPIASTAATVLSGLGPSLTQLGNDLSGFLTPILDALTKVGASVFPTLLAGIGKILVSLGPLIATLVEVGSTLLGPLLGGINTIVGAVGKALQPVLKAIGPVFVTLVNAVAPLIAQIATGLSPILAGLAPILGRVFTVLAPVISSLVSGLQPIIAALVPVIGVLVDAIGKILTAISPLLPPLGKLISSLISGLLPVLTPIIGLVAQTASQIGGMLVNALISCMPALKQIVMAASQLLPAFTPMIPLLGEVVKAIVPIIPPVVTLAAKIITMLVPVIRQMITIWVKMQTTIIKWVIPIIRKIADVIVWLANKIGEWLPKIGAWFSRMYSVYIKPPMDKIGAVIRGVWNNVIKPAFDKLREGVDRVKSAFSTAVDGIGRIWNKLKEITKKPVNFVIGTIYNNGIRKLVNKVASFAGLGNPLGELKLLARGGTLGNPAKAGPMVTNGPMAIVGEGKRQHPEFVIPTDPAYRGRAQALWAQAGQKLAGGAGRNRMGGEGAAFARGGQLPMLASGGIIGGFMKGLGGFDFLDPAKSFKGALGKLVGSVPGGGMFRDAVAGIPPWLIEKLVGWFKSKVGFGGGGPGVGKGLAFAKAQDGKPYGWGAVGPGAYDCSGLWSAIVNVIKGRNPYSRLFSTFGFTGASAGPEGFRRGLNSAVRVGVTNAGVGHMAGTIRKTNIESSGSAGVRFGGGARGADDGLFPMQYGLKADSGALMLKPGWNPPTFNGTGRPEYLETPRRRGGLTIENLIVQVPPTVDKGAVGREVVGAIKEYERRSGRGWRS